MAFTLNEDKGSKTESEKLLDLQRSCREGGLKYLEDFYCQDRLAIQCFQMPLPGHPKGYTLLHEAVEVSDRISPSHICKIHSQALPHTPPPAHDCRRAWAILINLNHQYRCHAILYCTAMISWVLNTSARYGQGMHYQLGIIKCVFNEYIDGVCTYLWTDISSMDSKLYTIQVSLQWRLCALVCQNVIPLPVCKMKCSVQHLEWFAQQSPKCIRSYIPHTHALGVWVCNCAFESLANKSRFMQQSTLWRRLWLRRL